MWSWWLAAVAGAADCEPDPHLDAATRALLEARVDDVASALDAAAGAMSCGAVTVPETLARAWLLEGAAASIAGETADADQAFGSARRLAPELWIGELGDGLRTTWLASPIPEGQGTVRLTGVPDGAAVWVDGAPAPADGALSGGLHLVQVGAAADDIRFGRTVIVRPGQDVGIRVPAFEMPAPPAPEPVVAAVPAPAPEPTVAAVPAPVAPVSAPEPANVPASSSGGVGVALHVGVGAALAAGSEVASASDADPSEPAVKLGVPVEVGLVVGSAAWGRATVGIAPLLFGEYLFETETGTGHWPVAVQGSVAAGGTVGGSLLGVAGVLSLPGRLGGRLLAAVYPSDGPVAIEARVGANFPTQRAVEPAGELVLTLGRGPAGRQ